MTERPPDCTDVPTEIPDPKIKSQHLMKESEGISSPCATRQSITPEAHPLSTSANQLVEMNTWLMGIAKCEVMLETWQGEVMRWNPGLDKWQTKMQDIKNELDQSQREVRMLKEKRIREVRLSQKELE